MDSLSLVYLLKITDIGEITSKFREKYFSLDDVYSGIINLISIILSVI